jgi:hypothetical protein
MSTDFLLHVSQIKRRVDTDARGFDCADVAPIAWPSKMQIRFVPREGCVDHSMGDLPAASGHRLAATIAAMLFEYYACVAETQYPAAHTGLLQSGALCPGAAHQRNYFFQFNQSLCALREYRINPRNKLYAKRHQGR